MKNMLLLFFVAFLFTYCKREPLEYTIKGVIFDKTHDQPVTAGELSIYKFEPASSAKLMETVSVANGSYNFTIERESVEKYEIHYESDLFFNKVITLPFSDLKVNEPNIYDIETTAKSFVKIHLKNKNSPSEEDELKILKTAGKTDCEECCQNTYFFFYGIVDEVFNCQNDGKTYFSFYYWVNGDEFHKKDSVYSTPFDTVQYELVY